jgi:competence protein ComEC
MDTDPARQTVWSGLMAPGLLAFAVGTALQLRQPELWALAVYGSIMALTLVAWSFLAIRRVAFGRWQRWALLVACALLGFSLTGLRASLYLADALPPALEGRDIDVVGVVAALPQATEAGLRFRLAVESASLDGAPQRLPPRLDLGWYNGVAVGPDGLPELQRQPLPLQAGERWQLRVRLKAPHGGSNPHGFDYELWLWEQGVQATGYVRTGRADPEPRRLAQTGQYPVAWLRQQVREQIFSAVPDRSQAGLIAALVVGDQRAIDRADWDVYRATGVAHLMSISGLHITMFAWAAALLLGGLWRRSSRLCLWWPAPSAALLGGVLLAAAYAVFSGWGVPAQRTVLMLAAVALLRLSGKRWPWPVVWLLALALVVVADPWALWQAGFWLSFVAVGVLFASGEQASRSASVDSAPPGLAVSTLQALLASAGTVMREQWVITLALTPLTLLLFGQVSLVGLLANALAIPWVTLLVTPLAMLGVLVPPVWPLAGWAISAMGIGLQMLADLPFAVWSVPQAPLWAGAAGVLGGVLLVLRLPWAMRGLGLPLMLPVLLWQPALPPSGTFEVLAPDIGQGNALIVRTAGHALVYDAGPRFSSESDAGHRVLVPLLRALGTRVDRVVLSHRDSDHTGGASAVLAMQPQADLISSLETGHELLGQRAGQRCLAGMRWRWDGVDFEVLYPQAADYEAAPRPNALSCTLHISAGAQAALLAGDIEQAQEARLVASGVPLAATLLLVPHHGSKTSSSAVLLDAVQPRIALVQAGYRNRFGHPAAPVLARYAERGIRLVDSPHCGAMRWRSDQPGQVECQRQMALRYWHHRPP